MNIAPTIRRLLGSPRALAVAVRTIVASAVLSLAFAAAPAARADSLDEIDDFQTWNSGATNYLEHDRWTLGAGVELRLDDDSTHAWFVRVSQLTRYRAGKHLAFEGNLSYVLQRFLDGPEINNLRLELGAIPRWNFSPRTSMSVRSRVELWWREEPTNEDLRLRLFPRLTIRLDDTERPRTIEVANEFLFSREQPDTFFQNRFYPISVGLPVGRDLHVDLYVMLLSMRAEGTWRHAFTLGQNWRF